MLGFSRILDSLYGTFGGVCAFGYKSAESKPIWNEVLSTLNTLSGAGLGRFWARSTQRFLSGKQRMISPISRRPNFTKFKHNTKIGVAMKTFGTEF